MLSVSKEYLEAVVSDTRDMPYRVTLGGGLVCDKTKIPTLSLEENVGSNEGVALGTANSATLRFTLKDAEPIDYNGMLVEPESGIVLADGTIEWLPLGKFWVTNFSTSNDYKTITFSCADGMYQMTGEYISSLVYPAHIRDVAHEIVSLSGVGFAEPSEWPEVYLRRKPEGLTYREAIGHVAGCCGCNARFNRYGKLEFTWYCDSGITISRSIQYLDGLTKLNFKPLEVDFEITGQKETYNVNIVSDGNGGVTATPGYNVIENETVVLSVNPFGGYELATIYAETEHGDIVTLFKTAEGGYSFVQPDSNVNVVASFRKKDATLFQLTVRAFEGGSIDYERGENENYFSEGDEVSVTITADSGKQIDKIVTTPHGIDLSNGSFVMPKSDVTITVYFKDADVIITPYSWLQKPATPPTDKPYWAIFYKDDPNLPTCQKYYCVWFDSWSATLYSTAYDMDEYKVQFNGYYYCGSKNNGHGNHEWDSSVWTGNGDSASSVQWNSYLGFMWSGAENNRLDKQYCLLASNVDLYKNGSIIFEANAELITDIQTDYIQDGMDVREVGSLSYWKCPDTFSTPLPAQNWMILMPEGGLYMTMGDDGLWHDPLTSYPSTMIAFFYDSIEIQCVGAVDTPDTEEFYIASVTNGQWAYLRSDNMSWDVIHALPEGAVIGFRNPLLTTESKFVYADGNSYNFSGILATNRDLYVGDTLFMRNNACRICDCVSASKVRMFSLMRSAVSDSIIIDCEVISVSTEGDTLFLESERITARGENDSIILSVDTTPLETEKVTLTYTNPLIYEKMVESISNCVRGVVYTPARIKYRGNPALQAGDIVVAPDRSGTHHNILIIQQTLNFGGGLNGEISSPGKTEKSKSFSSVSPVTTQIKKEVKESNAELEQRLASNNALVFGSMYKELGEAESKIASVVEWQGAANATMARIEQTADENSGKIALVVGQNGIVNEDGQVQGSVVVEAINGETEATINADKIFFEGQELNIKVPSTNIVGQLNADQINADGIEAKDVKITGDITINSMLLEDCAIVAGTDTGTKPKKEYQISWRMLGQSPTYCYGTANEAVEEDIVVSVVAGGKVWSGTMEAGTNSVTIEIKDTVNVINRPNTIYLYKDDTYMTVSKGIMPYSSGDLQLGAPNHRWKEIYADTAMINTSDEREKNSIEEIPQKYSDMFYKLTPVIYKMNNGTSDRFHVGFGAQSVERAMSESGIDSQEFAGLIKSPIGDDYKYGLRYSEFIALAVLEIQKLNKRIVELEEQINGK